MKAPFSLQLKRSGSKFAPNWKSQSHLGLKVCSLEAILAPTWRSVTEHVPSWLGSFSCVTGSSLQLRGVALSDVSL
eukprot:6455580-Karenia_brevis.AAC.2